MPAHTTGIVAEGGQQPGTVATGGHVDVLAASPLFAGVRNEDVEAMLSCLDARRRSFGRGELLARTGDKALRMGLVLAGSVAMEQIDAWGDRSILGRAVPGETFGEAYACSPGATMGVDVRAETDCTVLFLDIERVARTCTSACAFHTRLIRNLLGIMAARTVRLTQKIADIAPRTIRARLMSYLSARAAETGSRRFTVPFDRQQLADYLCVDRSALSHELSKMRAEGIVAVRRNEFELLA